MYFNFRYTNESIINYMFFFCISNKPQRIEISYFYLFKNIVVQKFKLGITSNQFNPATCLYLSQSKS